MDRPLNTVLVIGLCIMSFVCKDRDPLNPLDPDNPNTRGQAYTIQATATGIGKVKVHWRKLNQPEVKSYRIYRAIGGAVPSFLVDVTDAVFLDAGLQPYVACTYFYRLIWEDGRELHQSPTAGVVTFNAPTGLTITNVIRNRVEMQWSNLSWLDNYARCRVYRQTGTTYSLYDSTSSSSQYVDTRVDTGITYHYKVMAVATDGSESNYSSEAFATPGNSAPVIDSLRASQPFTGWGEQVTITCYAHDNDDDPISYSWEALDGGTISGFGKTVTFTVPQDTLLTHRVKVTVSDNFSIGNSVTTTIESAQLVFSEDFDSYAVGTFPSSRGWSLIYGGAGASYQYVDNTHSVSGGKSLHLVGSSCWSANAFYPISIPSRVRVETEVFVDQIVSCGCTSILAHIQLVNPNLGTWGTAFGMVEFNCDGNVYANQGSNAQAVLLMPYSPRTWYRVRLDVDLTARSFDVYVDHVLRGSNLIISDTGMPTGITLSAAHGGNPTVWFDDLKVWAQ
jgi:hypothetical protein